jgi:hypothetical protein
VITGTEIQRVAAAAGRLPPAASAPVEGDFVTNLLETVLDYQLRTGVVSTALEFFRSNRRDGIRTLDDLERVFGRFPENQAGDTALAVHLWGYRYWTRARQLRGFVRFFRSVDVVDAESLRAWAHASEFADFEGRVKGLGRAVYEALVMRQGVDTVKPDVHVRRFAEGIVGRRLGDEELIELVSAAARRLGLRPVELDWRIWAASQTPPAPRSVPDA